jgi:hypothetical protein
MEVSMGTSPINEVFVGKSRENHGQSLTNMDKSWRKLGNIL